MCFEKKLCELYYLQLYVYYHHSFTGSGSNARYELKSMASTTYLGLLANFYLVNSQILLQLAGYVVRTYIVCLVCLGVVLSKLPCVRMLWQML